jgi:hypothetical protein
MRKAVERAENPLARLVLSEAGQSLRRDGVSKGWQGRGQRTNAGQSEPDTNSDTKRKWYSVETVIFGNPRMSDLTQQY